MTPLKQYLESFCEANRLREQYHDALVTTPRSEERGFSVLTGRPTPYPSPKAPSEPWPGY